MSQSDPVAQAIAAQGVPHHPANLSSDPLAHDVASPNQPRISSPSSSSSDDDDLVAIHSSASLHRLAPFGDHDHDNDADDDPHRASTDSLSFGYRDHLLPLSLSTADPDHSYALDDDDDNDDRHHDRFTTATRTSSSRRTATRSSRTSPRLGASHRHRNAAQRRVTLLDGIALTVGVQIGSGIFSSPGVVTLNTGSIGASLVVWLLSGLLAWTGASSYAELGASIPLNGGSQAYLAYSFGPATAFLFTWSALVALKPGAGAIVATIFGEYIARVIYHVTVPDAGHPHNSGLDAIPPASVKLIACLVAALVTLLNAFSNKLGTRTQLATTSVKLVALAAVPILAIVQAARGKVSPQSAEAFASPAALFRGSATNPSAYALALYSGLWAYDGWDQSCFVAGEMKRVERDLPRVIHTSLSIVIIIFFAAVTSYFVVLPADLVKRTNTVALDYGSAIGGTTGGILFALLVAFSCFGALNGQVYTTARLILAASREGYLPTWFGEVNPRTRTPVRALGLQLSLIVAFTVGGSGFASLVNFYGVCSWSFYLATVLGLLVLRIKEPNLVRPYKTWLPTPILFAAVALFLLLMPIFSAPLEALAAFGFILAGIPVYFITQPEARKRIAGLRRRFGRGGNGAGSMGRVKREGGEGEGEREEEEVEMLPSRSSGGGRSFDVGARGGGGRGEAVSDDDEDDVGEDKAKKIERR